MQYLVDEAPARGGGGRIDQLYVYQWNGGPLSKSGFDSGLTNRVTNPATDRGTTRPILRIYCAKVGGTGCAAL